MLIKESLQVQKKAKNLIPGMTQLLSKRPDMFSEGVWPGYYSKAKGVEVWDMDHNHYIDMSISGIGANILGYADDDVDEAVCGVIKKGSSCSLNAPEEVELADLLCQLHPWAEKVRFGRCGGEAMAMAVRIARAHTGRDKVAFCGYHGWHDWYLAANLRGDDALGEHLLAGISSCGVPKGLMNTAFPFRYNRLDELEEIVLKHKDDLAAIVMESIRNKLPTKEFIEGVRNLADQIGAVLIVDEVSFGFRLNTGGAHLKFGLQPDIAVFSKGLGNGYSIAAIIGRGAVMESSQDTFISSTMWTERIGPTAALAMIKKHQRLDAPTHMIAIGDKVLNGWIESAEKNNIDINAGGISPIVHFNFLNLKPFVTKALFVQLMLEKGYLASNMFYAMYAHQDEHVRKYLNAVDQTFSEISTKIKNRKLEESLKGSPSRSGFQRLN